MQAPARASRDAKLTVGDTDDPLEREADEIADRLLRTPDPALLQRCPGGCPDRPGTVPDDEAVVIRRAAAPSTTRDRAAPLDAETETALARRRGAGTPLPPGLRAFAERRIGADFSAVRLHADAHAADLARRINARAFTIGSDVFMGRDHHAGAGDSIRLLAHELVHVVQQGAAPRRADGGGRGGPVTGDAVVQRQPADVTTATPTVWATPAIDALAVGPPPPASDTPGGPAAIAEDLYFAILNLHAAIRAALTEVEPTVDRRGLIDAIADARSWVVAGFPMAVAEELANGLMLLGDAAGADRVWTAARAADAPAHERSDAAARAEYLLRSIRSWGGPPDDPATALLRAGVIVHALEVVGRQYATLDPARGPAEKDRERAVVAAQIEVLIHLFAHIQAVIDHIIAATHPDPRGALDALEALLSGATTASKPIWHEEMAIIVADFDADPAVLKDFFAPEDTSRQVAVEFYGDRPEAGSAAEGLHAEVGTTVEIRQMQVDLLRDLDEQGLVALGGDAVHPLSSDDALRAWTLQRFDDLGGNAEALAGVVSELARYFAAFTIQSKQNIRDEGVPLVNAEFPQAATGELIHDCGVYAMRVLYALSLVGARLGLHFYTVRLPVHVAVVVTGPPALRAPSLMDEEIQADEAPLFVVHNGLFLWAVNEPRGPDLERNIGEFAAGTFIPTTIDPGLPGTERERGSVDVPYRVQAVVDPATQRGLQQAYDRLWVLIPPRTGEGVDDRGLAEASYIALLDAFRTVHNEGLRPLSQTVCDTWAAVDQTLLGKPDVTAFLGRLRDVVDRVHRRRNPLGGAARGLGVDKDVLITLLSEALGVDVGERDGRSAASAYFHELHERLDDVEEGAALSLADAAVLLGLDQSATETLVRSVETATERPRARSVAPALSTFRAELSASLGDVEPYIEAFRLASDELQSAVDDPSLRLTWGALWAAAQQLTFHDWLFEYKGYRALEAEVGATLDDLASGMLTGKAAVTRVREFIGTCRPLEPLR